MTGAVQDPGLLADLARLPGLVETGVCVMDGWLKLALRPITVERAYGEAQILRRIATAGSAFATDVDADVVVGAETAGIPLGTAVSLDSGLPFAFVRKAGHVGHVPTESAVLGHPVAGKRVLLVDDAVWRGSAISACAAQLAQAGATLVGVFCIVDMRDVADEVAAVARTLPMASICSYMELLAAAADVGVLGSDTHALVRDAIVNKWSDDDPRWSLLEEAS